MSNFNIIVDRNGTELNIDAQNISLPYGFEGQLWKDLKRVAKSTRSGNVSNEVQDLIDFATAIFHLDKVCPRDEREKWVRKIHLKIGLRNPARFHLIEDDMKWALSILGGDNFTFEITQIAGDVQIDRPTPKKIRNWGQITDIVLLSGGQDSFAGAAKILEDDTTAPLLVRINTGDRSNLSEVTSQLASVFNRESAFYSQTVASLVDPFEETPKARETSQRLRSFYFLAIGSALAKSFNVNNVHINENGIMAIHLPIDPARSSTFSTRTAYPQYLSILQGILRNWIDHPIEIKNVFSLKTKTFVIQECARLGLTSVLKNTVSCAHSATVQRTVKRQASKRYLMAQEAPDLHCGYCFPCLLRRISMWKAGLSNEDVNYATDPFKVLADGSADNYSFVYEATSAVLGLMRISKKFATPNFIEMISDYPQIAECASVMEGNPMREIITLHQQFSLDVREYIDQNCPYLNFFFDPQLSRELQARVATVISSQMFEDTLALMEVDRSDSFYKQMKGLFESFRLRVQIALADNSMTEEQIKDMYTSAVISVIGSRTPPLKLTQQDGKIIKDSVWHDLRSRPCPPFW